VFGAYIRRFFSLFSVRHYDLVIVEKELFPFLPASAERLLRRFGVPILLDYDDAIFHNYDLSPHIIVRRCLGGKIDVVMRSATVVTGGNTYLLDRARRAGAARTVLIPTVVDAQRYCPGPKKEAHAPLVVGWIGSPSTSKYLIPLLPLFASLHASGAVRFVAVGARASDFADTLIEVWEWQEATEVALIQKFDIGIMPLPDSPWEQGKCGYKLIQYMACGIPVVASPVGVNCQIVKHGENGFLAKTPQEWEESLAKLLEMGNENRRKIGLNARETIVQHYSLQSQAPKLLGVIKGLVS